MVYKIWVPAVSFIWCVRISSLLTGLLLLAYIFGASWACQTPASQLLFALSVPSAWNFLSSNNWTNFPLTSFQLLLKHYYLIEKHPWWTFLKYRMSIFLYHLMPLYFFTVFICLLIICPPSKTQIPWKQGLFCCPSIQCLEEYMECKRNSINIFE